ncbi:MAG: VWA domain-containing protein [Desulfurococcales archaeon]|nr:VWA domain-containing protein [Desulfurococcales archaeon]
MTTRYSLEELKTILLVLADEFRREGERIGTGEVLVSYSLSENYMGLSGRDWLDVDELVLIIKSSWTTLKKDEKYIREKILSITQNDRFDERVKKIHQEIMKELEVLGARPGTHVSIKRLTRHAKKKERVKIKSAYTKLKRIGAIKGPQGSEKIADNRALWSIAHKLAREGYSDLLHAAKSMKTRLTRDEIYLQIESKMGFDDEYLSNLSESALLKIGEAAIKKHDISTAKKIARTVKNRILEGRPVRDPERILSFLQRSKELTPEVVQEMVMRGNYVDNISIEMLSTALESMDEEKGASLLASYLKDLKDTDIEALLDRIGLELLWRSKPPATIKGEKKTLFQAAIYAAKALREAKTYASSLDPARADMSDYYIDKTKKLLKNLEDTTRLGTLNKEKVEELLESAEIIVGQTESLASGIPVAMDELEPILLRMEYTEAVEILRKLYRSSTAEGRDRIAMSLSRMLTRLASRNGLSLVSRKYKNNYGARLDLRASLYNIIRMSPRPLVFWTKLRTKELSLAIDTSSSMKPYASWTILVASLFSRHIRKIVTFSHEYTIYNGPFSRRSLAEILLNMDFYGRTNISNAIDAVSEPSRRIIVVTDLEQTIDDKPPWIIVRNLVQRGKTIVFIVPEKHDLDMRKRIVEEGGRVIVARTPRQAAKRILTLISR